MIIKTHDAPKDWFEDCSVSIVKWLMRPEDQDFDTIEQRMKEFTEAYRLAKEVNSDELRGMPYVGYDIEADTHYFIFKYENNGTTITVRPKD